MLPQFDRDVFDTSPDKIAKVDERIFCVGRIVLGEGHFL